MPRLLDIDSKVQQYTAGDPIAFTKQAKQNMLGADVSMIERFGFLLSQRQDFLHARRIGNVAPHLLVGPCANLLLHLLANASQVEAEFQKDINRHTLTQLEESEQDVFGADEVVVEAVGFLARERKYLLGARREVCQGFKRLLPRACRSGSECFPQ